jgi:ADP-ribose pyrophosphatase YjhB (NUDIX family)
MGKQKSETSFNGSAVIEHPRGTERFVLIEETAPHKRGLLNLPGGNEDFEDHTLLGTAIRETKEETGGANSTDPTHGLDIEIDGLIATYTHEKRPKHRIAVFSGFVLEVSGVMNPTPEHPTVNAYSIEEIDEFYRNDLLRHPRVHHAIHAYLSGLAIPISLLAPQQIRESVVTEL